MMLTFSLHCDEHVQQIQDTLSSWCSKLRFPYKKSGVVHLRRKKRQRSDFNFKLHKKMLQCCQDFNT